MAGPDTPLACGAVPETIPAEPAALYLDQVVGRVAAATDAPSTATEFTMWAAVSGKDLDVGRIVAVRDIDDDGTELGIIFGVVEEPTRRGSHPVLLDYLAHDGNPAAEEALTISPAAGGTVLTYRCRVLHSTSGMYRPAPPGPVYWANAAGVAVATRVPAGPGAIPYGVIDNGPAGLCPVYLDEDYLSSGREAAHMLVSGKSGLAAKSSAVTTLISAVLTHASTPTAAVVINTKAADLIFGDIPAVASDTDEQARRDAAGIANPLTDLDLAIYTAMGVAPEAFPADRYQVWAPADDTGAPATLRRHPALQHNLRTFSWGLTQVLPYLYAVLGEGDEDPKFDALLADITKAIVDSNMESFNELAGWFESVPMPEVEETGRWRYHDGATVRKAQNRLLGVPRRLPGLVCRDRPKGVTDISFEDLQSGDVWAVDIAQLSDAGQVLVLTKVLEDLRRGRTEGTIGTGVMVFVDEANRLIPRSGASGPLRRLATVLREMAERSRHLGLSLILGAQLTSKLDERVTGNLATTLIGNTAAAELDTPGYGTLSPAVKRKVAGLGKGEYLASHPKLEAGALFVRLPRPPTLRAEDARRLYPAKADVDLGQMLTQTAAELGARLSIAQARRHTRGLTLVQTRQLCERLRAARPSPAEFSHALEGALGRITGAGALAHAHRCGETLLPSADQHLADPLAAALAD